MAKYVPHGIVVSRAFAKFQAATNKQVEWRLMIFCRHPIIVPLGFEVLEFVVQWR